MASEVASVGHSGFSSGGKGMVRVPPVVPKAVAEAFDDARAQQAARAEQMRVIINTMGQATGKMVNVVA